MNGIFIQPEPTTGVGWTVTRIQNGERQGVTQWMRTKDQATKLANGIAERTGLPIFEEQPR